MKSSIRKFIFHDLQMIDGYIDPPDALVFLTLLERQKDRHLDGAIAEIGVYYGRSYFLVRKIAGAEEKILGIDLFDIGETADGKKPQYSRFLENGRKLGLPVDEDLIIAGDSTRLSPSQLIEKAGRVRFFSIDGGHMLEHVVADSGLAREALADHGVIAFDDTFNPAWPEVTVGLADFLRACNGALSAFCMTKYKTYVCRSEYRDLYREIIANSPNLTAFDHIETEFLGAPVTRLHNPIRRRMVYEFMMRTGMSALSERAYR